MTRGGAAGAPMLARDTGEGRPRAVPALGTGDADHRLGELFEATLVMAHSEKERTALTFRRGFGRHLLAAFVDHAQAFPATSSAYLRFMCSSAAPAAMVASSCRARIRARASWDDWAWVVPGPWKCGAT